MFKAKKQIQEQLKNIDLVIEVIDSRVPRESHNQMLDELTAHKTKLIIFNKSDLANSSLTRFFEKEFQERGYDTIQTVGHSPIDRKKLLSRINQVTAPISERYAKKGITKVIKIMIIGMPNTGKSTIINLLAQKRKTEVGNKPGVTKKQQ